MPVEGETRRVRFPMRIRWKLASLFVAVTVLSLSLGWRSHQVKASHRLVDRIQQAGGLVYASQADFWGPDWMWRRWIVPLMSAVGMGPDFQSHLIRPRHVKVYFVGRSLDLCAIAKSLSDSSGSDSLYSVNVIGYSRDGACSLPIDCVERLQGLVHLNIAGDWVSRDLVEQAICLPQTTRVEAMTPSLDSDARKTMYDLAEEQGVTVDLHDADEHLDASIELNESWYAKRWSLRQ